MATTNNPITPTTVSSIADPMNSDATRFRSGRGGVMPKVMMKASAMDSSSFIGLFPFYGTEVMRPSMQR